MEKIKPRPDDFNDSNGGEAAYNSAVRRWQESLDTDIIKPDFEKIKELRTLLDEEVKYIDHWLLEGGMGLVRSAQMRERKEFILMSLNRTVDLESTVKRLQEEKAELENLLTAAHKDYSVLQEENEQLKEGKKELLEATRNLLSITKTYQNDNAYENSIIDRVVQALKSSELNK